MPRPPLAGRAAESLSRALADKSRLLRKLRGSELIYREIFNATTEAIAVEDTRTGRFVEVNDPMVRMYGYSSREELLACSIGDLSEAVRELCLNIAKHARTQSAHLIISRADGESIRIELRDQGAGFDAAGIHPTGLGLFRIRERAGQFGGQLNVSSSPADGTCVTLLLPRC